MPRAHLNGDKNQQRKIVVAAHITMEDILKKQILTIVATLSLLIPMAIIGFAGLNARVKADIPFDFVVGGKQFQAGKYVVERLHRDNFSGVLIIRSTENGATANFHVNNVTDKSEPQARLIFRRYGNQRFLARIYDGQSGEGQEVVRSKAEREAAKKRDIITQHNVEPEIETVVARAGQ